ncbi:MAG TPA: hypothetical protein VFC74_02235, partial [Oscillospiraceae bacterium]|nr:hypothetical protein [Oscillospiraceae bacterium]
NIKFILFTIHIYLNFQIKLLEAYNMLNHKGTITLETDRLVLRRFSLEDAEDIFNNWAND